MTDMAAEFNSKNARLLSDLERAAANIKELQNRKIAHTNELSGTAVRTFGPNPEDIKKELKKLESVLEAEKRYLYLLKKRFHEFIQDADKVKGESHGAIYQSVPNFKHLTGKYFDRLSKASIDINELLEMLIRSNDLQRDYVKKSKGNIFTSNFAQKFGVEFKNYLAQTTEQEAKSAAVLKRLSSAQAELRILGLEIKHAFDSISFFNVAGRENKLWMALFFAGLAQNPSATSILGLFAAIATLFVARQFVK